LLPVLQYLEMQRHPLPMSVMFSNKKTPPPHHEGISTLSLPSFHRQLSFRWFLYYTVIRISFAVGLNLDLHYSSLSRAYRVPGTRLGLGTQLLPSKRTYREPGTRLGLGTQLLLSKRRQRKCIHSFISLPKEFLLNVTCKPGLC
jgi:hypothetical protein